MLKTYQWKEIFKIQTRSLWMSPTHLVKNGHLFAGRCRTIISFRIPISNTRAYSIDQKATATVQIDIAHKLTC